MSRIGRTPASVISERRNHVEMTPNSRDFSRNTSIDLRATLSSNAAWAKSFTVLMLVMVSTTCPDTIARDAARAAEFTRTRGMKKRMSRT